MKYRLRKVKVNNSVMRPITKIESTERNYICKYVGQFSYTILNTPPVLVDLYYYPKKMSDRSCDYIAMYLLDGKIFKINGDHIASMEINAVKADNGEIIYSRHISDMRNSEDNSAFIGGDPKNPTFNKNRELLKLLLINGQFFQRLAYA